MSDDTMLDFEIPDDVMDAVRAERRSSDYTIGAPSIVSFMTTGSWTTITDGEVVSMRVIPAAGEVIVSGMAQIVEYGSPGRSHSGNCLFYQLGSGLNNVDGMLSVRAMPRGYSGNLRVAINVVCQIKPA